MHTVWGMALCHYGLTVITLSSGQAVGLQSLHLSFVLPSHTVLLWLSRSTQLNFS